MLGRVLKIGGAGEGAAPILSKETPLCSTLAITPARTPKFLPHFPSTLPSHFLDFPISHCSVTGRPVRSAIRALEGTDVV